MEVLDAERWRAAADEDGAPHNAESVRLDEGCPGGSREEDEGGWGGSEGVVEDGPAAGWSGMLLSELFIVRGRLLGVLCYHEVVMEEIK